MHAHSLLLFIDFNDASDVVRHYQQKQANDRAYMRDLALKVEIVVVLHLL